MGTKIEWTEETWNPVVGCSKVSDGCKNCYAMRMANRLAHIPAMIDVYMPTVTVTAMGKANWTGVVRMNPATLEKPLEVKKPTMWFVNSMSDLFHEKLSFEDIDRVFAVMALCPQHIFQVLTKRAERMVEYFELRTARDGKIDLWFDGYVEKTVQWPLPNVWLGVSVENQQCADARIPHLLKTPAAVRFLSCEPLLSGLELNRYLDPAIRQLPHEPSIDWVIAGGESGPDSRPMHPEWVATMRDQCGRHNVPFFFKQWGDWIPGVSNGKERWCFLNTDGKMLSGNDIFPRDGGRYISMKRVGKSKAGSKLDGIIWHQMPKVHSV